MKQATDNLSALVSTSKQIGAMEVLNDLRKFVMGAAKNSPDALIGIDNLMNVIDVVEKYYFEKEV